MRRRRRPAVPEPQAVPQRNGKPLALAGRPGRRRKTKTISSSGVAERSPHAGGAVMAATDAQGASGMKNDAGGGVVHAVKGGRG